MGAGNSLVYHRENFPPVLSCRLGLGKGQKAQLLSHPALGDGDLSLSSHRLSSYIHKLSMVSLFARLLGGLSETSCALPDEVPIRQGHLWAANQVGSCLAKEGGAFRGGSPACA